MRCGLFVKGEKQHPFVVVVVIVFGLFLLLLLWAAEQYWVRCGSFVKGQQERPFVTGVFITSPASTPSFYPPPLFVTIDLFAPADLFLHMAPGPRGLVCT